MKDRCDFCQRKKPPSELMVSPKTGVAICFDCLAAAHTLADPNALPLPREEPGRPRERPLPRLEAALGELVEALERRVVGQREAKEALAFAFLTHLARLKDPSLRAQPHLLLVGPTGSGKTHLVRTLADHLGLPTVHASATSLTQAGYVGDDVETLLARLLREAGGEPELAEVGVIFLDEFDKLARKSGEHRAEGRDVSGEGVQQALLRMVEGAVVPVPQNLSGPARYGGEGRREVLLDTSRILWIFAGSFEGLEEVVRSRLPPALGFTAPGRRERPLPTHEDLVRYGIIPELVGRIGQVVLLSPLTEEELARILEGPEGLLAEYRALLSRLGLSLRVEEGLPRLLARRASRMGFGARGLRALLAPLVRKKAMEAMRRGGGGPPPGGGPGGGGGPAVTEVLRLRRTLYAGPGYTVALAEDLLGVEKVLVAPLLLPGRTGLLLASLAPETHPRYGLRYRVREARPLEPEELSPSLLLPLLKRGLEAYLRLLAEAGHTAYPPPPGLRGGPPRAGAPGPGQGEVVAVGGYVGLREHRRAEEAILQLALGRGGGPASPPEGHGLSPPRRRSSGSSGGAGWRPSPGAGHGEEPHRVRPPPRAPTSGTARWPWPPPRARPPSAWPTSRGGGLHPAPPPPLRGGSPQALPPPRGSPLPHDLVVVDEASMMDDFLAAHLLQALKPKALLLLLVGDPHQLPPWAPGSPSPTSLPHLPHVRLTEVRRQAAGSAVARAAALLLEGREAPPGGPRLPPGAGGRPLRPWPSGPWSSTGPSSGRWGRRSSSPPPTAGPWVSTP